MDYERRNCHKKELKETRKKALQRETTRRQKKTTTRRRKVCKGLFVVVFLEVKEEKREALMRDLECLSLFGV